MSAGTKITGHAIVLRIAGGALISLIAGVGSLVAASQPALASQGASMVTAVGLPAVPSAAGPIVSGYHTTACIDDLGDSSVNDTPVVMWGCNGSAEQYWTVETDGTIQVNGKCIDIYRDQKANRTKVELWTCTGGANQQWQAVSGTLVNPISGKCLDDPRFNTADGTQLELYTCNGGRNQQWELP